MDSAAAEEDAGKIADASASVRRTSRTIIEITSMDSQDRQKSCRRGRSERGHEAYSVRYVECPSDARTKPTGFFTIRLIVGGAFRPSLEETLIRHPLGFNCKGPGFQGQPLFRRATGPIGQDVP